MLCYLLRKGRIVDVAILSDLSDKEAVEKAHALFEQQDADGFEVWDSARVIVRYPTPGAKDCLDRPAGGPGAAT